MTKRTRQWLHVLWILVVLAAVLAALPLLAIWSIVVIASIAVGGFLNNSLPASLSMVLWPVAGTAGLAGLVTARWNRRCTVRSVRIRQALLLAGIAAAAPPLVGFWPVTFDMGAHVNVVTLPFAMAFAVLIVQAEADIIRLQGWVAAPAAPAADPAAVSRWFLGLAMFCASAVLIGHFLLAVGTP